MKRTSLFILTAALAIPVNAQVGAKPELKARAKPAAVSPAALKPVALTEGSGKNRLSGGGWFTWKFDKKPRLGPAIIKIQVYSRDKKKDSSYEITGESGMLSMRAHDSGPVKFQLNKKGDYLLPIDVVMPGEWEVVIRIKKGGRELFAGKVDFNV